MSNWYRCKVCGEICNDAGVDDYPTVANHLLDYHVALNEYVDPISKDEV